LGGEKNSPGVIVKIGTSRGGGVKLKKNTKKTSLPGAGQYASNSVGGGSGPGS